MNTMTNLCAQQAYVKSALIRNMLTFLLKIQVSFEKKKKKKNLTSGSVKALL